MCNQNVLRQFKLPTFFSSKKKIADFLCGHRISIAFANVRIKRKLIDILVQNINYTQPI